MLLVKLSSCHATADFLPAERSEAKLVTGQLVLTTYADKAAYHDHCQTIYFYLSSVAGIASKDLVALAWHLPPFIFHKM